VVLGLMSVLSLIRKEVANTRLFLALAVYLLQSLHPGLVVPLSNLLKSVTNIDLPAKPFLSVWLAAEAI
jgi:hypothetical protein